MANNSKRFMHKLCKYVDSDEKWGCMYDSSGTIADPKLHPDFDYLKVSLYIPCGATTNNQKSNPYYKYLPQYYVVISDGDDGERTFYCHTYHEALFIYNLLDSPITFKILDNIGFNGHRKGKRQ